MKPFHVRQAIFLRITNSLQKGVGKLKRIAAFTFGLPLSTRIFIVIPPYFSKGEYSVQSIRDTFAHIAFQGRQSFARITHFFIGYHFLIWWNRSVCLLERLQTNAVFFMKLFKKFKLLATGNSPIKRVFIKVGERISTFTSGSLSQRSNSFRPSSVIEQIFLFGLPYCSTVCFTIHLFFLKQ